MSWLLMLRTFSAMCAGLVIQPALAADLLEKRVEIRIIVGNTTLNATLADNATVRDFASLLPLTVELKDYASTEKISDLPRKLSTAGAPTGSDPDVGDIAYYSPWGNLAIYYKDFGYSKGLIKLGRIDAGIESLRRSGPLAARIELREQ